jgi:hypothetical protein
VQFEIECDDIVDFDGEVAKVLKNGEWGLIDNKGDLIINFGEYLYINEFNEGYSKVSIGDDNDSKDGIIDKNGEIIIECNYTFKNYGEGLVPFADEEKGLWGYMSLNKKIVIQNTYDDVDKFSEGLAAVCKKLKWGFIDNKGDLVIDFIFDEAGSFCSGISRVKLGDKIGYIDKKGKNITGYIYENGYYITNNYAIVSKDDEYWGMINLSGKEIINCEYDEIQPMSEGLIPAKTGDYWGYLDEKGETVIDFQFDRADCFSEGLASVELNGRSRYIDRYGNIKLDYPFSSTSEFKNGLAKVEFTT